MPNNQRYVRRHLFNALMRKIEQDTYPSSTMLDLVEGLLDDSTVRAYADLLLAKVEADTYPSVSLIRRLEQLA